MLRVMAELSSLTADMDAAAEIAQAFEARAADDPALADAELDDVLRLVPGKRAILSGRFGAWGSRRTTRRVAGPS
jgi:hypothetical protein